MLSKVVQTTTKSTAPMIAYYFIFDLICLNLNHIKNSFIDSKLLFQLIRALVFFLLSNSLIKCKLLLEHQLSKKLTKLQ